jgi:hypothetical protein
MMKVLSAMRDGDHAAALRLGRREKQSGENEESNHGRV